MSVFLDIPDLIETLLPLLMLLLMLPPWLELVSILIAPFGMLENSGLNEVALPWTKEYCLCDCYDCSMSGGMPRLFDIEEFIC